jgi:hypothetical protein
MAEGMQQFAVPAYQVLHPEVLFDKFIYISYYLCFKEVLGPSNTHFFNVNLSQHGQLVESTLFCKFPSLGLSVDEQELKVTIS